jgi:hypothetical protein
MRPTTASNSCALRRNQSASQSESFRGKENAARRRRSSANAQKKRLRRLDKPEAPLCRGDLQSVNPQYVRRVERPWISWKRWWTPLGGPIHLEQAGGFLTDPLSEFARFYPLNVFRLDDLLQRHCVVLCGEPGLGKTAELGELEKRSAALADAENLARQFSLLLRWSRFSQEGFSIIGLESLAAVASSPPIDYRWCGRRFVAGT